MNPCEMNAAIAALTNHLFCTLSKEEFLYWSVVLNELSKSMFSLAALEGVCKWERREERRREKREEREEKD